MRVASLDLGSNTCRLLVAQRDGDQWRAVHRGLQTPRMGQGLRDGMLLPPDNRHRAQAAVAELVTQAREHGARSIALAATMACRRAADGAAFVAQLGSRLGLDEARVLSGVEEAALSRRGVTWALTGPMDGAVLADVGGGSSELIPLDGDPRPPVSLALGAVSLSEAHLRADPPSPAQLAALEAVVDQTLAGLGPWPAGRLVASAGTAATLASLMLGATEYDPDRLNNLTVSAAALEKTRRELAALPLAQRRLVPGLEPDRADIILGGLAVLAGLLKYFHLGELTTMDAGLLEGILLDAFDAPAAKDKLA